MFFGHLTHILLDGARMGIAMSEARLRNKAHESLYRGENLGMLDQVSPQLFSFNAAVPFGHWCLKTGWGHSWGVMLKSSWPMPELHKHFRKFLTVKTEGGKSLFFRFYDPRVLRIFLPTSDTAQLREFFGAGAIDYFIMEDEDPAFALRIWHENGFLKKERMAVADLIAALPEPGTVPNRATEDELPPETLAVIAELREQYPDVDFPGPRPTGESAKAQKQEEAPQPKAPEQTAPKPAPPKPAFSPMNNEGESAADSAVTAPKPKTKWNMFD